MSGGETSLTFLGKIILYVCIAAAVVAALVVERMLGYDGILWGAAFGAAGGGVGGIVGQILAQLTGQVHRDSGGRGQTRPPGAGMRGGR